MEIWMDTLPVEKMELWGSGRVVSIRVNLDIDVHEPCFEDHT
jgi:hypothetical protein